MTPQKAALKDETVEQVEQHRQQHQPRGEVGVVAQPQEQPAQRVIAGPFVAHGPQQEVERQYHEEQRRDFVPAPAAHGDVPAADGQDEGGSKGGGNTEQKPRQGIHGCDGQDCGDQRSGFERNKRSAQELEQGNQIEGVKGWRFKPAGAEGAVGPAFHDAQGIQRSVGLVDENARRHLVQPVDAQKDRQQHQQRDAAQFQPQQPAVGLAVLGHALHAGRSQCTDDRCPKYQQQQPANPHPAHGLVVVVQRQADHCNNCQDKARQHQNEADGHAPHRDEGSGPGGQQRLALAPLQAGKGESRQHRSSQRPQPTGGGIVGRIKQAGPPNGKNEGYDQRNGGSHGAGRLAGNG